MQSKLIPAASFAVVVVASLTMWTWHLSAQPKRPNTPIGQLQAADDVHDQKIAELTKRVDALEGRVKHLPAAPAAAGTVINKGMTVDEVVAVIGVKGAFDSEGPDWIVYTWEISNAQQVLENGPAASDVGSYVITCLFRDGKLERISRRDGR